MDMLRALDSRENEGECVVPSLKRLTLVDWDPTVGDPDAHRPITPGQILQTIVSQRALLRAVHIVSWRRCYDEEWQRYLMQVNSIEVVYEHYFVSLDHVQDVDDSDAESDEEYDDAGV